MRFPTAVSAMAAAAMFTTFALPADAARPESVDTDRDTEVTLNYAFSRGDATSYVLEANFASEALDATFGATMEVQLTLPLTYEVQSTDDAGIALIATSLRSPSLTVTEQGEETSASSLEESLQGARLSQAVSNDGTVSDRTGAFTVHDSRDTFVLGFVADVLGIRWVQFPQESIAVGESWLQIIPLDINDSDGGLSANIAVRYTLAGFETGTNIAVIDTEYTTTIDGEIVSEDGRGSRLTGRGTGDGYILFDIDGHRIRELHFSSGLVIASTLSDGTRRMRGVRQSATLRSRVIAATP